MAENLNIGIRINGTSNQANNDTVEKYCYEDDTINCNVYGGLYQWDEMMQYIATEGEKGICPPDWHIPTDFEWCIMEKSIENQVSCTELGWRGYLVGGHLKDTTTTHWNPPNTGATNSSGFKGLPGGTRFTNGTFSTITNYARFWSSNEEGAGAWFRSLYYENSQTYRGGYDKAHGFSVRCLQD